MRRVLVIFLILVFPLNVFALPLSASSMRTVAATEHVDTVASPEAKSYLVSACDGDDINNCDADPDEPRASADFHDSLHIDGHVQCVLLSGQTARFCSSSWQSHLSYPKTKPPRLL